MAEADAESVPNRLRQNSGLLLRATSVTLTGGAAVLPPAPVPSQPTEETPLRQQQTRRTAAQDQVHDRLVGELSEFLNRFKIWLILALILIVTLVFTLVILFVRALFASITYFAGPCDQPLRWYMLLTLLWGQFPGGATSRLQLWLNGGPIASLLVSIFMCIPGWLIIAWGVYMVNEARTCPDTNPGLYFPLQEFIYGQIAFAALSLLITTFGAIGLRRVLLILNKFSVQPGCEKAVHKLPQVASDSDELIDQEDGKVMDCSICMDSLGNCQTVVKAPCSHLFHEECLATWCKNHLDCPLCRQQVGEAEPIECNENEDSPV